MAGCAECGGPAGINPKTAIFASGLSGQYSSHTLCQRCWKEALQLGGPGLNVQEKALGQADAARARARARRGY